MSGQRQLTIKEDSQCTEQQLLERTELLENFFLKIFGSNFPHLLQEYQDSEFTTDLVSRPSLEPASKLTITQTEATSEIASFAFPIPFLSLNSSISDDNTSIVVAKRVFKAVDVLVTASKSLNNTHTEKQKRPAKRLVTLVELPHPSKKLKYQETHQTSERKWNKGGEKSNLDEKCNPNITASALEIKFKAHDNLKGVDLVRQMKPLPCSIWCKTRCCFLWTFDDRINVFKQYWSLEEEAERRDWIAQQLKVVSTVTKIAKCTTIQTASFKYYLPHRETKKFKVCENFFLATLDEEADYVNEIAEELSDIIMYRRKMKFHPLRK